MASRSLHSGLQGLRLSLKVYHMYTFLYKGPNSMVLHFFLGDCLLYKVNILFLMIDMSVLAWACPQTFGAPSGHANNWISLAGIRRKCWRGHTRKPLVLRQDTPTCSGFSRPAGAQEWKNLHPESNLSLTMRLLSGCRFALLLKSPRKKVGSSRIFVGLKSK